MDADWELGCSRNLGDALRGPSCSRQYNFRFVLQPRAILVLLRAHSSQMACSQPSSTDMDNMHFVSMRVGSASHRVSGHELA